jgi:hypothetical protein
MKGPYSVRMLKRLRRTMSRTWSSNLACSGLPGPVNSLPCPAFLPAFRILVRPIRTYSLHV